MLSTFGPISFEVDGAGHLFRGQGDLGSNINSITGFWTNHLIILCPSFLSYKIYEQKHLS